MRKKYEDNKKKILILLLLLGIGIGYALLNANLSIAGVATVSSNTWDIHFENVQISSGSVTGDQVTKAATIETSTSVEYSIVLNAPGDYYEFTVDAKNGGSLDAMIGSISSKLNGQAITTLPNYLNYSITYSDDLAIEPNHALAAGAKETYKVRIEFKRDISVSDLPSEYQVLSFTFGIVYVQSDGTETNPRPGNTCVYNDDLNDNYIYSVNDDVDFYLGQPLPNGITVYNSYEELRNASNHLAFMRYKVENGIITKAYIGVIKNDCVYIFQGGIDESALDDKPIYDNNLNTANSLLGTETCEHIQDEWSDSYLLTCGEYDFFSISGNGNVDIVYDNRVLVILTDEQRTGFYTS